MKTIQFTFSINNILATLLILVIIVPLSSIQAQPLLNDVRNGDIEKITTNIGGAGLELILEFRKGPEHNHPLMAVWIEDHDGNYIQTLYVAQSIAKGVFAYGDKSGGTWQPGEILRPAALPYWSHKRNVLNDKGNYMPRKGFEVPDAYSGATPKADFRLDTRTDKMIDKRFKVLLEINQSWDWNNYWTNDKFPDDTEYKTSSQPAVVYAVEVDPAKTGEAFKLIPIGRSHYAGSDGKLYNDLETLTTALKIASDIQVTLIPRK